MPRAWPSILLPLTLLAGCGGETSFDPDAHVTIDTGVYGLLYLGCDTAGCESKPSAGMRLLVLDHLGIGAMTVAEATSDQDGFYEVALDPGSYALAFDAPLATAEIEVTTRTRCDFETGPGGGIWLCNAK